VPAVTASYSGFANGDTALSSAPTCATEATGHSDVGDYATSCTGGADPNYTITNRSGSVSVVPAPLTVTASSGTTRYGHPVPAVTASYSGFANGDTALSSAPTCATEATGHSDVGDYATSCTGGADPNYTITNRSGSVSVAPAPLTVTASSARMVRGASVPAIVPSYLGLVLGQTAPAQPAVCSTAASRHSPIGTYPTTCSGAADANYAIGYAEGAVTVTAPVVSIPAVTPGDTDTAPVPDADAGTPPAALSSGNALSHGASSDEDAGTPPPSSARAGSSGSDAGTPPPSSSHAGPSDTDAGSAPSTVFTPAAAEASGVLAYWPALLAALLAGIALALVLILRGRVRA
jgi:hypothetical protein